jgi:hypothetical protein
MNLFVIYVYSKYNKIKLHIKNVVWHLVKIYNRIHKTTIVTELNYTDSFLKSMTNYK